MNVFLAIGKGIEADAKDVANFFEKLGSAAEAVISPTGLLALAVLAVPVGEAIASGSAAAASDGLNIALDAETAQLLVSLWPDLKNYIQSLAVKPAS